MKLSYKKVLLLPVFAVLSVVLFGATTFAHVVVTPSEAAPDDYIIFNVSVPNEKNSASMTKLKLNIPNGVSYVRPTAKPGWTIKLTQGANNSSTTSIEWTSGMLEPDRRDDFSFSAKTPADMSELKWKAYQTYDDGETISWDQTPKGHDDDSVPNPYSVTTISDTVASEHDQSSSHHMNSSDKPNQLLPIALSVGALVVGVLALAVAAFRKK